MKLEGKVALVTGAGRGIGRAIALLFAQEGAKLAVAELDEATGRTTSDDIMSAGGEALFLKTALPRRGKCKKPSDAQWLPSAASTSW